MKLAGHAPVQHVFHQGGFSGPGYAGDHYETPERKGHVEVLQVVLGRPADDERLALPPGLPLRRHRDLPVSPEVGGGE